MSNSYEIGAYYFPNFHVDPRNEYRHGTGWTEWELLKKATPRFEGHQQPKIPLWGYEDESDPNVMAGKIDAAADHGLTSFIFDWYWYEDGPFLERALEQGFLKAPNNDRLKFALMWANHDWSDLFPAPRLGPWPVLYKGAVSPEAFRAACGHIIKTYFSHPSYWRVNGGLYFSIYDVQALINGFGSAEATREALEAFRQQVREAGLGELHLNAIVWSLGLLPGQEPVQEVHSMQEELGFDSVTTYVWLHHNRIPHFPSSDYGEYREMSMRDIGQYMKKSKLPYFPNVSMGWDNTPRRVQSDIFDQTGPYNTPVLRDNTPEQFKLALEQTKAMLDQSDTMPKLLTINAWNEWTEGSYLEPDTKNGMAYLEAIRDVFGR